MLCIRNNEKISEITMKPTAFTKCKLGGDWYKSELTIRFTPDEYYPDYSEVQAWIMENVDGKEFNIEEVVAVIYEHLFTMYLPAKLHIKNDVINCRTHFNVTVEKWDR